MHGKKIISAGKPLNRDNKLLILVHGRGANAEDILTLSSSLNVDGYTLMAPQAHNHTWYPYSFLVPPEQNEPFLSSALDLLKTMVADAAAAGLRTDQIFFAGFSQGACLVLEFVCRNAQRYGGIAAFTGGLIGDEIDEKKYTGDFENTPVFIGSANPDSHVPVQRVLDSAAIMRKMHAAVSCEIYDRMAHTIIQQEIDEANSIIFK